MRGIKLLEISIIPQKLDTVCLHLLGYIRMACHQRGLYPHNNGGSSFQEVRFRSYELKKTYDRNLCKELALHKRSNGEKICGIYSCIKF